MMFSSITVSGTSSLKIQNNAKTPAIVELFATKVEDFLTYWNDTFRLTPTCDVTYEQFNEMVQQFNQLTKEEKEEVIVIQDQAEPDYTIGDIIKTLTNKFYPTGPTENKTKQDLDQNTMIWIVSGVAIFGITTILIFYILKNKKIIK